MKAKKLVWTSFKSKGQLLHTASLAMIEGFNVFFHIEPCDEIEPDFEKGKWKIIRDINNRGTLINKNIDLEDAKIDAQKCADEMAQQICGDNNAN